MNDAPQNENGLSTQLQRDRWDCGLKYVPCDHTQSGGSFVKPLILTCSILLGGFLALWAVCVLVMQVQGVGL
jgi:hypothetical protein